MNIYSKKAQDIIYKELQFAEERGFIKVHEYRNFTDFCIIPLIKRFQKL